MYFQKQSPRRALFTCCIRAHICAQTRMCTSTNIFPYTSDGGCLCCLIISVSLALPVHLAVLIWLSFSLVRLNLFISLCLSACHSLFLLSVCLSLPSSLSLSVCMSLSMCLSVYPILSLSLCLSVYLSVCLSCCLPVCLCLSVSLSVSVCLSVCPPSLSERGFKTYSDAWVNI